MTVVYVDSVFVLNALMDYLLVLCAARLAGIPSGGDATFWRACWGAPMPWRYFCRGWAFSPQRR
ncbi:MAG: hypothetical protein EP146_00175 [Oscillibacter sp.]|uniref:hypothetical protein n=1 Tax=Oscillibacter sp. TaxID=1945593 RepID=UPI0013283F72|nr:hypothetical protein [Oscillibacter sp.]MUU10027.1 hypothetical protein [Oscillibacter sp.]